MASSLDDNATRKGANPGSDGGRDAASEASGASASAASADAPYAREGAGRDGVCGGDADVVPNDETPEDVARAKGGVTRRQVLAAAGCGVVGLIAGGVLAKWGVVSDAVASGRIDIATTPQKMIVTDRARCSGCQRCEMMCTLKNDGVAMQSSARVRVHETYFFGDSPDTGEGSFGSCQFTIKSCRQCAEPRCAQYCPVHAIHSDEETGARVIDADVCIGCGMCHEACPWNLPKINPLTGVSTKCVSCGRCAEQCPNGAIKFIDWIDIAQECIDKGLVSTVYAQGR